MIVMPDSETLALEALRQYMEGLAEFGVAPPKGWNNLMPFGAVLKVGGDTEGLVDKSILSVSMFGPTRKQASRMAREAQAALKQATVDGFSLPDEGVLSYFKTTKPPVEMRDGLTGKHADASMFDATYTIWARPHYV